MQWFFSKVLRIKCLEGGNERIVLVYKDVNTAFPTVASNWHADVKAAADMLHGIKAKLGAKFDKELTELGYQLDVANRSLREVFGAIYVVFQSDPCRQSDYLASGMKEAIENEYRLRAIHITLTKVRELKDAGADDATIEQTLIRTYHSLAKPRAELERSAAFASAEKRVLEWSEE
jgi:hypothetical protein